METPAGPITCTILACSPLPFLWFGSAPPAHIPALTFIHYSWSCLPHCLLLQSRGPAS